MKLFWKSYGIIFLFASIGNGIYLVSPDSASHLYYIMLGKLNSIYYAYFALNIFSTLSTIASAIIVLCYAFDKRIPNTIVLTLFYFKLFGDITGHHYEWKFIQGAFYHSSYYAYTSMAALFIPLIPSYIAHWRCANSQK